MALKAADFARVCMMCLETRPLKIVGRCKHAFCTECLSTVLRSEKGEVFACPSCKFDCPCPGDGVKGLVDFTGEAVEKEKTPVQVRRQMKSDVQTKEMYALIAKCQICLHQKKEIRATNMCRECDYLYICDNCSEIHGKNKATVCHQLVPLVSKKPTTNEAICNSHEMTLTSFCLTCSEPVCKICVTVEHGDHNVRKLGDVIESHVDKVKLTLEKQVKKLKELQYLRNKITLLQGEATTFDRQEVLVKEIEDHAEKCIGNIVKWKEDLKIQVKDNYKVIREIPVSLQKVSEVVQNMQQPIDRAVGLLAENEPHPMYLDDLVSLEKDFEALARMQDDVEGVDCMAQLCKLHHFDCRFVPEAIDPTLGKLEFTEKVQLREVFTHTMPVDSDVFIPCVANLGQMFAVAHPSEKGEPSGAVDIYESPGTLKCTLADHVLPSSILCRFRA
jgi:hypothetical protein